MKLTVPTESVDEPAEGIEDVPGPAEGVGGPAEDVGGSATLSSLLQSYSSNRREEKYFS